MFYSVKCWENFGFYYWEYWFVLVGEWFFDSYVGRVYSFFFLGKLDVVLCVSVFLFVWKDVWVELIVILGDRGGVDYFFVGWLCD